jgi:predicted permease
MITLRDAYRSLRATPLVSAVAVASLMLGIGGNTAMFSILNSLVLKPLPVHEPRELVVIDSAVSNEWFALSYPVWTEIRNRRLLERPFAWATDRVGLSTSGATDAATVIWATGDVFEVLGVSAAAGRTFDARDDRRGGGPDGPVTVVSDAFARRRFGAAGAAVGRILSVDGIAFTIIGVTPPAFFGLNVGASFDAILPLETEPLLGRTPRRLDLSSWTWLQVMSRRRGEQTASSLAAALAAAQPQIRAATMPPFDHAEDREGYLREPWTVRDAPGGVSRLRRQYGRALATLVAIVGLVLLVACANIATLMLGRTAARRRELAVRVALGASRWRLVRQLLVESLMIAVAGAVLGVALAHWGSRLLVAQLSTWASSAFLDLSLDWRVLGVTALTTIATALLFGTVPAHLSARVPGVTALRTAGADPDASRQAAGGLVVAQVALSLVLLTGAGLFLRSFVALAYRDLGFDRSRVLVAMVDAGKSAGPAAGRAALYERIREAAATVPGVESAAASLATPLGNAGVRLTPEVTVPGVRMAAARILMVPVSPGWFGTFGTRLLAGRDFDARDRSGARPVVIVNQAFAQRYLGGGAPPVGRTIESGEDRRQTMEIVGVVEDAAFVTVRDRIAPTIYQPFAQAVGAGLLEAVSSVSISIRAADGLSPAGLSGSVAAAIGGVDRDLAITLRSVAEQLRVFYIRERLLALLSVFFATLALLIAGIGLYGVTAGSVARRRAEIGIRMALGADARRIVRLVLGRVLWLSAAGAAAGVLGALWAARLIQSLLFGMDARDPLTFTAAALVLLAVVGLAGWLPARRASRIDPADALRHS